MRIVSPFFIYFLLLIPVFSTAQSPSKDTLRAQYAQNFESLIDANYRALRLGLNLSPNLQKELQALKTSYLEQVNKKIETLSSSTELPRFEPQFLMLYPNLSKVLLDKSNLSPEALQMNSASLVALWKHMPNELFSKTAIYTDQLKKDQFHLTFPYHYEIYQDLIDASPRQRDQVLNFLLWTL